MLMLMVHLIKKLMQKKNKEIEENIIELKRLIIEDNQLSKMTFSKEDLLVMRDIQYINSIRLPMLYDKFMSSWNSSSRDKKLNLVMDYIEDIELTDINNDILVTKINFRNSFFNNFYDLFKEGFIDYDITNRTDNNSEKIRFSEYLPYEKVDEHITKLRNFYDVQVYSGLFNFDTGMIDILMPEDEKLVRISPNEPVEFNNGYHGSAGINAIGVNFSDDDFPDFNEIIDDKLIEQLKSQNIDNKEIYTVDDEGMTITN